MSAGEIYGRLDFPVLMIIGTTLVAQYFPRKKHGILIFIIGSIINCAIYFLLRFVEFNDTVLNTFLGYLNSPLVYILAIVTLYFSCKASFPSILMAATIGYCVQNFSYCFMSIIRLSLGLEQFEQWYFLALMLIPIFAFFYSLLYLFYLKNEKYRYHIDRLKEKRQIIISAVCILGIAFVSVYSMKTAYESSSDRVWYITYMFNMIVCAISITGEFELLRSRSNAIESTRIKMMWENDKMKYEKSQENIQYINVKMHDLRHRLDSLNGRVSEAELKEIKDSMNLYATMVETGCEVLNMVLNEKYPNFIQNNVHFTSLVKGEKLNYLPKENLYSVFENALTNAYEAVMKLEESKRFISMTSKDYGDYLMIQIENYCIPEKSNTIIGKTTKDDKGLHGYGLLSMKMMMEKFSGKMNTHLNGELFTVSLLFPSETADRF